MGRKWKCQSSPDKIGLFLLKQRIELRLNFYLILDVSF